MSIILLLGAPEAYGQSETLIEVAVPENQPAGHVVYAFPPAPGGKHYLLFHGRDSDSLYENKLFKVSPQGLVTTAQPLTYTIGNRNQYDLTIVLRDLHAVSGGTAQTLRVNVEDLDTFRPVFSETVYHGFIKENSPENTVVRGLENCFAEDRDTHGIDSYQIVRGNEKGYFRAEKLVLGNHEFLILKTTGNPIVRDSVKPRVTLTVKAEHGGLSASIEVKIEILENNDFAPEFDQDEYSQKISEDTPVMSPVLMVTAGDKDGGIEGSFYYYLDPGSEYFSIGATNGLITLVQELDYSKGASYDLNVYAEDRGFPSQKASTQVKIEIASDVENFPATPAPGIRELNTAPVFTREKYGFSVKEDLPTKAAVGVVHAFDGNFPGPNSKLTYSLSSDADKFSLGAANGVLYLKSALDFETDPNEFRFKVQVKDQGSPQLSAETDVIVKIQNVDENRFAPVFENPIRKISVAEDTAVGTSVLRASASDQDEGSDAEIVYSAVAGTGLGYFSVDEDSGEVKVAAALDRERSSSYDLEIQARDQGLSPFSSILFVLIEITDENDNYPDFSAPIYEATVPEGSPEGTFVDVVHAIDKDDTTLSYGPSTIGLEFSVEAQTGVIRTLKALSAVDDKREYAVTVTAADNGGKTSKVLLRVKVTGTSQTVPQFTKDRYEVSVLEYVATRENLVCVAATGDNGPVGYALVSTSFDWFRIDKTTGEFSWSL